MVNNINGYGKYMASQDSVNHPSHYKGHPSGIECIQVTEHMGFNLGNAVKYIWRCDLKKDAIEDLEKAAWYIQREIAKRKRTRGGPTKQLGGIIRVDSNGFTSDLDDNNPPDDE